MNSRESLLQIIAGLTNAQRNAIRDAFLSSSPQSEVKRQFLSLPCLLASTRFLLYLGELTNFIDTINTIDIMPDTGKPVLATQHDKEYVISVQKKIIQYVVDEILGDDLAVNRAVTQSLHLEQANVSLESLVLVISENILAHLVVAINSKQQLDDTHRLAVESFLCDRAQINRLVIDCIGQAIFAKLDHHYQSFSELIEQAHQQKTHNYQARAKEKILQEDVSRVFDHYPALIDAVLLEKLSTQYAEYIRKINPKNLVVEQDDVVSLSHECEDYRWLETFKKRIIRIGASELLSLNHSSGYSVRAEIKHCLGVSDLEVNPERLLYAYTSAVIQAIISNAFLHGLDDKMRNNVSAVSIKLRVQCMVWVQEVLAERHPLSREGTLQLSREELPGYYPGVGVTAAIIAGLTLFGGIVAAYAAHHSAAHESSNSPTLPKAKHM